MKGLKILSPSLRNDNESPLRSNLNKRLQSLTGSNNNSALSPMAIYKQNSLKNYLVPELNQRVDSQTTFFGTNHFIFLNLEDASSVHSEQVASYQYLEQKRSLKELGFSNRRSIGKTIVIDHVTNKIEEVVNDGDVSIFDNNQAKIKPQILFDRIKSGDADLDDLADENCGVEKLVEQLSIQQKPFQSKLGSVQYL